MSNFLDHELKFKDKQSQIQAVHLLHYISSGELGTQIEDTLAVPKLLCGMPISAAVPMDVKPKEQEINNANKMLKALISNWGKLGATSPDGLRNSFLSREGVIEEKENIYQLTLESSSIDVLLDFIPWNISVVKLPWMDQLIYVSWR